MSLPEPGSGVDIRFTKWGGGRHHGATIVYLGEDEHGLWYADPVGNEWSGGPASFTAYADNVLLVPRDRGFTAMHYELHEHLRFSLYVDITTVPEVTSVSVGAVDLDLDVVRLVDGTVFLDDEDEFAEHQVRYGYPPDVIAAAEAESARVVDEVRAGAPHFAAGTAAVWRTRYQVLRPQGDTRH